MAFMIKEIIDLKGILFLMLLTVPSLAVTNYDCNGKAFQCVNSTHFMICVDLGRGISTTIDDVIIPCPTPTVCKSTNRFECEFPTPIAQVTEVSSTIVNTETTTDDVTTFTPLVTTSIPFEEYYNTLSTTTLSESELQQSTTDSILTVDQTTVLLDITNASTSEIVTTSEDISMKPVTATDNGYSSSVKPSLQLPITDLTVIAEPITVVPDITNASKSEVVIASEDASIKPETGTDNGPVSGVKPSLPLSTTDSILTVESTTVLLDITNASKSEIMITSEDISVKSGITIGNGYSSSMKPSLRSSITEPTVISEPTTVVLDITNASKSEVVIANEDVSIKPETGTDNPVSGVKPSLPSSTTDSILTVEPTTYVLDITNISKSEVILTGENANVKQETVSDDGHMSSVKSNLQSSIIDSILTVQPTTIVIDIANGLKSEVKIISENSNVKLETVTDKGPQSSVKPSVQSLIIDSIVLTEPTTVVLDVINASKSDVEITSEDASIIPEIVTDNGTRSSVKPSLQSSTTDSILTVESTTVVLDITNDSKPELVITGVDTSLKPESVTNNGLKSDVKPSLPPSITDSTVTAETTTVDITNASKSEVVITSEDTGIKPKIVTDNDPRNSVKSNLQSSAADSMLTIELTTVVTDIANAVKSEVMITGEGASVKLETVADNSPRSGVKPSLQHSTIDSILLAEPTTVVLDTTNSLQSEIVITSDDASIKPEIVSDNGSRSNVKPSLQSSTTDSILTVKPTTTPETANPAENASVKPETVTDNGLKSSVKPSLPSPITDYIVTIESTIVELDITNASQPEIVTESEDASVKLKAMTDNDSITSVKPSLSTSTKESIFTVESTTYVQNIKNTSNSEAVFANKDASKKSGIMAVNGLKSNVKQSLQVQTTDSVLTVDSTKDVLDITNASKQNVAITGGVNKKSGIMADNGTKNSVKQSLQASRTDSVLTVEPTIYVPNIANTLEPEMMTIDENANHKPTTMTNKNPTSSERPILQTSTTDYILMLEPTTVVIDFTNGAKQEIVITGEDASVKPITITNNDSRGSVQPSLQSLTTDNILTVESTTVIVLDITNTSKSDIEGTIAKSESTTDKNFRSSMKPTDKHLINTTHSSLENMNTKMNSAVTGQIITTEELNMKNFEEFKSNITIPENIRHVLDIITVEPVTNDSKQVNTTKNTSNSKHDVIIDENSGAVSMNLETTTAINEMKSELSTNFDHLNTLVTEPPILYADFNKFENLTSIDIAKSEITVGVSNNTYYQESTLGSVGTTKSTSEVKEIINELKSETETIKGTSASISIVSTPVETQSNSLSSDSVNATVIPTISTDANIVTNFATTILNKKLETLTNIHKNATKLIDLTREKINNNLPDDAETIGNDLNGLMGNSTNRLMFSENILSTHYEENKTLTHALKLDSNNKTEALTFSVSDSVDLLNKSEAIVLSTSLPLLSVGIDTTDSPTISIRTPIDDNTNTTSKYDSKFKYSQTETTNKPLTVTQNQTHTDNLSLFMEHTVVKNILTEPNKLTTGEIQTQALPPPTANVDSYKKIYTENVDKLSQTNTIIMDASTSLPSFKTSVAFTMPDYKPEKKSEIPSDSMNNMTEININHSKDAVNVSAPNTFIGEAVIAMTTKRNIYNNNNIVMSTDTANTTQSLLTVATDTNNEFITGGSETSQSEISITTELNSRFMPQSTIVTQLLDNMVKNFHNVTSQPVIHSKTNTAIKEETSSIVKDINLIENMDPRINVEKNKVLTPSHSLLSDTIIEGSSNIGHVLLETSIYTPDSTRTVNNKKIDTMERIKNSDLPIKPVTLFLNSTAVVTETPVTSNYQHFNTLKNIVFNSSSLAGKKQEPVTSTANPVLNTQSLTSEYENVATTASSNKITGNEGIPVLTSFSIPEAPKNVLVANDNQKVQQKTTNESNLRNNINTLTPISDVQLIQTTTFNNNDLTTTDIPQNTLLENKENNIPSSESNNNIYTHLNTQMKSLVKEGNAGITTSTSNSIAVTEAFKTISVAINDVNNTLKEESLRTPSLKYNKNSYLHINLKTQSFISNDKYSETSTSINNDITLTESQNGSLLSNEASNVQKEFSQITSNFSSNHNNLPAAGKKSNVEVRLVAAVTAGNDFIKPRGTPETSTSSSSLIETVTKSTNTDAIESWTLEKPSKFDVQSKEIFNISHLLDDTIIQPLVGNKRPAIESFQEKLLVTPQEFKSSTATNSFMKRDSTVSDTLNVAKTIRTVYSSTIPNKVPLATTKTLPSSSDSKQKLIDLQTFNAEKDTSATIAHFVMNHQGPQQTFENISGELNTALETESIKKDLAETAKDSSAFAESINTMINFDSIAIATSSTGLRLNKEEQADVSSNISYSESMNFDPKAKTQLTVQKSSIENIKSIADNSDQSSTPINLFTSLPEIVVTTEMITGSDVLVESNINSEKTHSGIVSLVIKPPSKHESKQEGSENNESEVDEIQDTVPAVKERAAVSTKVSATTPLINDIAREETSINSENKDVRMDTDTDTKIGTNSADSKKIKETPTHELIEHTRSTASIKSSHTSNSDPTDPNKSILNAYNTTVISNDQGSTPRRISQTKSTAVGDTQTTEFLTFESTTRKLELKHFTCNEKKRGRYADEFDCRKFYICLGNSHIVEGICPVHTVFSEIRKQCTKNLSHCIRNNQFRCVIEGRFSDFLDNNVYYICVRNNVTSFIRFKLQCQDGYHLNKTSVRCNLDKKAKQSTSDSDSSKNSDPSDQSMSSVKTEEKETSEKKFRCKNEGIFSDPSNCRRYFECKKSDKLVYRQRRKKCDSDEIFHADKKKCVDADSYECK